MIDNGSTCRRTRCLARSGLRLGVLGLILGLPLSMIGLRIVLAVPDFVPAIAVEPVRWRRWRMLCILVIAAAASSIPAARAATVDPARTLRAE